VGGSVKGNFAFTQLPDISLQRPRPRISGGTRDLRKRQTEMTANIARDWIGILAFFPLWAVTMIICFTLIAGPKKIAGIRTQKFLNLSALVLSVSSATAILIGLDCNSYINLPFAKNACYMLDSNRPFGLDLGQAAQSASDIFN
jgi:fucose 4-O-acetylase-like acetyltransferase